MTIGKISEFDIHKDDWKLYIERLQQYFLVNEIKAELQVPTLITVMGSESYELLVNLCTPAKPSTKTFIQLTEVMENHLQPKPSELAERYKFRQRQQKSGESISEYVAVLKKMSKTCEFGAWLEESLRDHKPLTYILGDKVGIPVMAASRLQRWAVQLSGYNYEIEYVNTKKNCADALSRLPPARVNKRDPGTEITYSNFVENFLPVTNENVKKATATDKQLSRIKMYVESGWPEKCTDEGIKQYFVRRHELYVEGGCVMWGYRMIIPMSLRQMVLKQLHSSHMGIVKTKCWARSYVWWPGIDSDVEALCRACDTCALEASAPPRAVPVPWPYHPKPWTRLHIDFLGPFKGKTYLVLIDSTSKWLEVFEMKNTNTNAVIKCLRVTFARFGLPAELVSDQGPPFTSSEFAFFLKMNGIRQIFSPAYHPASNGAAENAVKLCKRALKKAIREDVDTDTALQNFLLTYRNTVHSTTGETPAMLLQRRSLRTRLDLLRSERTVEDRVRDAQNRQTSYAGGVKRDFTEGDNVWARGYGLQDKWIKGTVVDKQGSRKYLIESGNGQFLKRHVDQIRRKARLSDVICPEENSDKRLTDERENVVPKVSPEVADAVVDGTDGKQSCVPVQSKIVSDNSQDKLIGNSSSSPVPQQPQPLVAARPKRVPKPVIRYGFEFD